MEGVVISGIQQVGIGVSDVHKAWRWYRENFGIDICVFEEEAEAALMLPYTGGKPQKRHAALAINLQGGGGFEIWQYTERAPKPAGFEIQIGDLGLYSVKIKSKNVQSSYVFFKEHGQTISPLRKDPAGGEYFFITDPYNNMFQITNGNSWFSNENKLTGAAYGAVIGVSDIDRAKEVYSGILGYDKVIYDNTGGFDDFFDLPGGNGKFRRVLLEHSKPRLGAFSKLLGDSCIELVQTLDRSPKKIFEGRYWGDLGFIHLCYDIKGMENLKKYCEQKGFPFTVDSGSFNMGEAAGHFTYIEDPDGTLIEFVETHKIPVIKKFGLYLNLKKRNPEKSLPSWIIKALGFNRIKD